MPFCGSRKGELSCLPRSHEENDTEPSNYDKVQAHREGPCRWARVKIWMFTLQSKALEAEIRFGLLIVVVISKIDVLDDYLRE